MTVLIVTCIAVFLLSWRTVVAVGPIVTTPLGDVLGTEVHIHKETVYQFRKIPYAEPPVGNMRFRKPLRSVPWTGTLNGTEFGPSCMQSKFTSTLDRQILPNVFISEDCLHLNVYVPRSVSKTPVKAVMIWVHGGAFLTGQGMYFDASYLSLTGDVIVVTINYRLGILGFYSTQDSASPGNYGLWDQKMAFSWVKDNIASFGGNPNLITIFGESAGAFSVALHSIAPHNKGIFQRVITQSGPLTSYQAYCHDPTPLRKRVTNIHGCDIYANNDKEVECMRNVSSLDLVNSFYSVVQTWPPTYIPPLGPVIDNDFLADDPTVLLGDVSSLSSQFFLSLDYMIGTVSSEGSLIIDSVLPKLENKYQFSIRHGIPTRVVCDVLIPLLAHEVYADNPLIPMFICARYEVGGNITLQSDKLIDMYTDTFYLSPSIQCLRTHQNSDNRTTFQYYFDQPPLSMIDNELPTWFHGSPHASELFYLFGIENLRKYGIHVSSDDIRLSNSMMGYWANFAKTGNPNGGGLPTWRNYDSREESYLLLSTTKVQKNTTLTDNVQFWLSEVPTLEKSTNVQPAVG